MIHHFSMYHVTLNVFCNRDRQEGASTMSVTLSVSMHSHNFEDMKLNHLRQVADSVERVGNGFTILPRGSEMKDLSPPKT